MVAKRWQRESDGEPIAACELQRESVRECMRGGKWEQTNSSEWVAVIGLLWMAASEQQ